MLSNLCGNLEQCESQPADRKFPVQFKTDSSMSDKECSVSSNRVIPSSYGGYLRVIEILLLL